MYNLLSPSAAAQAGIFYKTLVFNHQTSKIKALAQDIPIHKAHAEGIPSIGGFLVPDIYLPPASAVFENTGIARANCEFRPISSGSAIRARRVSNAVATWLPENLSIPESSIQLAATQIAPAKVASLLRFSSELAEDADEDVGQLLTASIRYSFGLAEDNAALAGDGSSTYGGGQGLAKALTGKFSGIAAASGHHSMELIDAVDLGRVMDAVLGSSLGSAKWYVSPGGFGMFSRISSTSGGLLGSTNPDGTVSASYLGFPIVVSASMGTSSPSDNVAGQVVAYFGSLLQSSLFVQSRGVTADVSVQHALEADQYMLRCTERVSIAHHDVGDTNTRAPIASLTATA
jgi:HK97 family phage major capsid protein